MDRFHFSLRGFLFSVFLLALGCGALLSDSQLANTLSRTGSMLLLGVAAVGALGRQGERRTFWLAVAVFGGGYCWLVSPRSTEPRPGPESPPAYAPATSLIAPAVAVSTCVSEAPLYLSPAESTPEAEPAIDENSSESTFDAENLPMVVKSESGWASLSAETGPLEPAAPSLPVQFTLSAPSMSVSGGGSDPINAEVNSSVAYRRRLTQCLDDAPWWLPTSQFLQWLVDHRRSAHKVGNRVDGLLLVGGSSPGTVIEIGEQGALKVDWDAGATNWTQTSYVIGATPRFFETGHAVLGSLLALLAGYCCRCAFGEGRRIAAAASPANTASSVATSGTTT